MNPGNNRSGGLGLAISFLLAGIGPSLAGAATVTNAALIEAGGKVAARFDLSWDKSWRDNAGHDACWAAKVAPATMIMCPCVGGLSHNEAESIKPEEATAGCQVLFEAVLARANRPLSGH